MIKDRIPDRYGLTLAFLHYTDTKWVSSGLDSGLRAIHWI